MWEERMQLHPLNASQSHLVRNVLSICKNITLAHKSNLLWFAPLRTGVRGRARD